MRHPLQRGSSAEKKEKNAFPCHPPAPKSDERNVLKCRKSEIKQVNDK